MNKMNNKQNRKGFTIIEVVLVLAIAGLIFLMVFIALPALQRSQRDTQRRQDVSRVMAQLQQYQTNNRGAVPADIAAMNATAFSDGYLKESSGEFNDPQTGNGYQFVAAATVPTTAQMAYVVGQKCSGESFTTGTSLGNRVVAVRIKLEGSGFFCQDNQ